MAEKYSDRKLRSRSRAYEAKRQLLKRIPLSYKRKLESCLRLVSARLPKSLTPSYPSSITIDPIDACNLMCPLCANGLGILNKRPTAMSIDTFKLVLSKIPSIEHICLFNWGEPFLNPALFKMTEYAVGKSIRVTVHSNFSLRKNEKFFANILESRLDELVISLDGTSPESYSKYRIGGDFKLVLSNIEKLMKMKKENGYRRPSIIWKFIVNRYNEDEIEKAKRTASQLGLGFEISYFGLSDDLPGIVLKDSIEERKKSWLPKNKRYQHPYYRNEYKRPLMNSPCPHLFETAVVNPDGKVFPCCWVTDEQHAFGDLREESFQDIWHNAKYAYSRSLFLRGKYHGQEERSICCSCDNYRKK